MTETYTVEEVAEKIHKDVAVSTVRKLIRDKKLDAVKIGKRYYVTDEALERFLTCPEPRSPRASGKRKTVNGSSSTPENSTGQVLALNAAARLLARPNKR